MALGTLVLAEGALAELFMTAHALAVEGVHTAGDQLVRRLLHMADRAVGIQGVHLALHGSLILARGLQLMAGSAVLGLAEQILMAGRAARVHGIGQHRRRAGLGSLVAGPGPGPMFVSAWWQEVQSTPKSSLCCWCPQSLAASS